MSNWQKLPRGTYRAELNGYEADVFLVAPQAWRWNVLHIASGRYSKSGTQLRKEDAQKKALAYIRRVTKHQRNPRRRKSGDYLVSSAHVHRYSPEAVEKAIASSERQGGRVGKRERTLIHRLLKGRHGNPRHRRKHAVRSTRRRNPRAKLFVLLAQRGSGPKLKYMGGSKFATQGHPVLFRSAEGARVVAKMIRLQFPMFRRYAFYARS